MSETTTDTQQRSDSDLIDADHGLDESRARRAEDHRGFVRDVNDRLNKTYGMGGGAVFVVLVGLFVAALVTGWWSHLTFWVPGITGVVVALYLARKWIYGREDAFLEQVREYCEANDLQVETLRTYYKAGETYPFFIELFEESPRERARSGGDDEF